MIERVFCNPLGPGDLWGLLYQILTLNKGGVLKEWLRIGTEIKYLGDLSH